MKLFEKDSPKERREVTSGKNRRKESTIVTAITNILDKNWRDFLVSL